MKSFNVLGITSASFSLIFLIVGIAFNFKQLPGAEMNIYMGCIYFVFALVAFIITPKKSKKEFKTTESVLDDLN